MLAIDSTGINNLCAGAGALSASSEVGFNFGGGSGGGGNGRVRPMPDPPIVSPTRLVPGLLEVDSHYTSGSSGQAHRGQIAMNSEPDYGTATERICTLEVCHERALPIRLHHCSGIESRAHLHMGVTASEQAALNASFDEACEMTGAKWWPQEPLA